MNHKENFSYLDAMEQLIDYYYGLCPGSIMPLLLLYLAGQGKGSLKIDEKARRQLDWKKEPERKYSSPVLSQFTKEDAAQLAKSDPAGAHILERWECNEMDHMSIIVLIKDSRIGEIRSAFQKRDEALGESMEKRRALFLFVQGLLKCPKEFLKASYLEIADRIISRSGTFESTEDLSLAKFEWWILGDIKGNVFSPYSRTPYVAAMLRQATVFTESSLPDAEMASMVSELLLKGNGIKKCSCEEAAKPYSSLGDNLFDAVILNFSYYDEKDDETSWHNCLKNVKRNLTAGGKFIGLIEPKYLFRMLGKQKLFKDIISDDTLDSIFLLPREYGQALVCMNKAKKHKGIVKLINLFDKEICGPHAYFKKMVSDNTLRVPTRVIAEEEVTLESFFETELGDKEDFRILPLRKFLKRIRKESLFGVSDDDAPEELSQVYIDREHPYSPFEYRVYSRRTDAFSIYEPAYYLDRESLLVNSSGNLEPHLYNGESEPAIFSEGLAFEISDKMFPQYLINELRKPYVVSQLNHWSASRENRHSEDEILGLKIYVPVGKEPYEKEKAICSEELDASLLPPGQIINDGHGHNYTIEKALGKGGFGISYLASQESLIWGEEDKTVVLKEFFSRIDEGSERFDGVKVAMSVGDIGSIRKETDLHSYLVKFIDEGQIMEYFSKFPGCRIRNAYNIFRCKDTNTYYYVMDYYHRGTLLDELESKGLMDERTCIWRIMRPLSIAISTMHAKGWLHLDIKAENVIIDDDGFAVLGDLGISQHYDENGKRTTKGGEVGSRGCCSPMQYNLDYIKEFHPELDVYSFAALMYLSIAGSSMDGFSPEDLNDADLKLSRQTKAALKAALDPTLTTTPSSVEEFMHMLPGCEDMEFDEIEPIEEEMEEDFDPDSFYLDDFDDMPEFT